MNQKQRDYLTDFITKNVSARQKELNGLKPPRPSLNNYLISAILQGEIVYQTPEHLAEAVRKRVLDLSGSDVLISSEKTFRNGEYHDYGVIRLPPSALFIYPKEYLDALRVYEEKESNIRLALDKLEAYKAKMLLKINLGSDAELSKLIEEADQLTSISLLTNVIDDMPKLSALSEYQQLTEGTKSAEGADDR
jgi:hypothetical protein